MRKIRILWTDDEIEALKPHILFLEEKGYSVDTCSNGNDTIDLVKINSYDLVFLDENMPGLSGIETLKLIREIRNDLPVVMGATLIFATIFVTINIFVDIIYGVLDPRVRVK